jgi:hypothetical protein
MLEAAMTEDTHFRPYCCDDALGDGEIQSMARRQISVSLVVGLALLAVAALMEVRTPQLTPARSAAISHSTTIH